MKDDFRVAVEHLRSVFPPPKGAKVKFELVPAEDLEQAYGDTEKHRNVWTIRVNQEQPWPVVEDTVLHEYAHVIAWRHYHPCNGDHDAFWGVAYAQIYCAYHGVR